jgi:hypothetical protein
MMREGNVGVQDLSSLTAEALAAHDLTATVASSDWNIFDSSMPGDDSFIEYDSISTLSEMTTHDDEAFPSTDTVGMSEYENNNDKMMTLEIPGACHFDFLAAEALCSIASFLDICSLGRTRTVCNLFNTLFSRDDAGWEQHCKLLWSQKIHICPQAQDFLDKSTDNGGAIHAYRLSNYDAALRQEVRLMSVL